MVAALAHDGVTLHLLRDRSMIDIATISAAFQGLTLTKGLLNAAYDAKVDSDAKAKISEALERLGQAQDGMFTIREELNRLQNEREDLQRKLQVLESWSTRAKDYELAQTSGGAVVYQFKGSPQHYACPGCFNKNEIHPLQDNRTDSGKYRCTGCGAEYPIKPKAPPPAPHIPRRIRPMGSR
jgi:predicted RNA-binding Zn-ribbon protein involved in translation (DUF1610 family)